MKYLIRFLLLMLGVALTTLGLVYWQSRGFSLEGMLLFDNGWRPHPIHILALGISLIPPSLWEIFVLEAAAAKAARERAEGTLAPKEPLGDG